MLTGPPLPVCFVSLHACVEPLASAGIGKLSTADGKAFADPEVLRRLTSSVSCALDEAAAALTRMRAENTLNAGQPDKYGSPALWLYTPQSHSITHSSPWGHKRQHRQQWEMGAVLFVCPVKSPRVQFSLWGLKNIGLNCSFVKTFFFFFQDHINKDFIYLYILEPGKV